MGEMEGCRGTGNGSNEKRGKGWGRGDGEGKIMKKTETMKITITWGEDGDGGAILWELPPNPTVDDIDRTSREINVVLSRYVKNRKCGKSGKSGEEKKEK
jgi:hypothetical protein